MIKNPMTKNGFSILQNTLNKLKNTDRPRIINSIKEARAHGDLKENAEYTAAKEEQFLIEKKIKEIEEKISSAEIIDVKNFENNGKIIFGTTVEITNLNTKEKNTYKIVGEDEADIKDHKISIKSPIARALILKSKNDTVKIKTPSGILEYKITDVNYI